MASIETRVARIAEALLAEQQIVSSIDVLIGLGWLAQPNVDRWMTGRVASLDLCIAVDDTTTASALDVLNTWADRHGLQRRHTEYRELRFTATGDPATEGAFRIRWATAESPSPATPPERSRQLTVLSADKVWTCSAGGDSGGGLLVKRSAGTLCLDCADLGHLVFLPSGDAALTRRAKKLSRPSAAVVRWNTRRNRYERQAFWSRTTPSSRPRSCA